MITLLLIKMYLLWVILTVNSDSSYDGRDNEDDIYCIRSRARLREVPDNVDIKAE